MAMPAFRPPTTLLQVLLVAVLLFAASAKANELSAGPVPPCASAPSPDYADVDQPLNVVVWEKDDLPNGWQPPTCSQWTNGPAKILLAAAGRFRATGGAEEIIRRLAAISSLTGVKYWSDSRAGWFPLFEDAAALSAPDKAARRTDFSTDELQPGKSLYFWQDEDHVMKGVIFQLTIRARGNDRLEFETVNASGMGVAFIDVVDPGNLQQLYVIEREAGDVWRYYSIARLRDAGPLLGASKASFKNRAAAYFRHIAGIPTDRDPPPSP